MRLQMLTMLLILILILILFLNLLQQAHARACACARARYLTTRPRRPSTLSPRLPSQPSARSAARAAAIEGGAFLVSRSVVGFGFVLNVLSFCKVGAHGMSRVVRRESFLAGQWLSQAALISDKDIDECAVK